MIAEGKVEIELAAEPGGAARVQYRQPFELERVLVGKPAETALTLTPSLFAVCAHAHRQAALQALGRTPSIRERALTAMETAREHVLRVALDWTEFLGEPRAKETAAAAMLIARDLAEGGALDGAVAEIEQLIARDIFGASRESWLREHLANWAATRATPAARLFDQLIRDGWMDIGAAPTNDDATVWARRARHLKLRGAGAGLGARLLARLVELAELPDEMRRGSGAQTPVPAARGPLRHAATFANGLIESYRVLAPTDVNFAPNGAAARALSTLTASDRTVRERQARLLINAIDPCVRYDLRFADA
ncbi:MAG: hypothetical protein MRY74_07645 [Neomegalonema sp.]|nr:hypothetical protein [Neomegalonema sp.]